MRITETKLKRIIRKIILENEMMDDQMQMPSIEMRSGSLSPHKIFDVIKKRMRYANSDIVRQVNESFTKDLSQMQMEEPHLVQPFMEFVSFCNRYCDDVHCGPQNPPQGNNWQQNETMMAQEGSKLGFSIADCSVICVEILG